MAGATVRAVLTRGIGRWQFLGAKVLSLLLLSAVGFIIAGLTVAASSLVAASLVLDDGGGLADAGEWSTVAVMFGKAVYGLAPYAILALFLSVPTSSSSMGIAIGPGLLLRRIDTRPDSGRPVRLVQHGDRLPAGSQRYLMDDRDGRPRDWWGSDVPSE